MKKIVLTFTMLISVLLLYSQEDTIRTLIFSEWRGDAMQNAYFELTNVGTDTLDLSRFTLSSFSPWHIWPTFIETNHHDRLSGTLLPGKSYVVANHYDELAPGGGPVHTALSVAAQSSLW